MANIFKPIADLKDGISNKFINGNNLRELKKNNVIINELRVCNGKKEDFYVSGSINKEKKIIYFASKQKIESGFILVDSLQNLYKITSSCYDKNPLFENETITTICDYVPFTPTNPTRSLIQTAEIKQNISDLHIENVSGPVTLNFDQKAKIEQTITIEQLIETVEDECKYRFKTIKDSEQFIALIKNIAKGIKSLDSLEDKIIKSVISQASGFLKDVIELLIKKMKNE